MASQATLTFPEVDRFVSVEFCSESHDIFPSAYAPGKYLLTKHGCGCEPPCTSATSDRTCIAYGSRYAFVLLRTLADADNASDVEQAHKVQDSFKIEQADVGQWEVPDWNQTELTAIRNDLLRLKATSKEPTTFGYFTGPEKIDHLYGMLNVAAGWGGVRPQDQTYVFHNPPPETEGDLTLTVPKVPVEGNGFWSITMYSKEGFMFADPSNYNSASQGTSGLNPDGSTTIFLGGCDKPERQKPSKAHCLPTQSGWGIVARFFRPSQAILDGSWRLPDPVPSGKHLWNSIEATV